MGNKTVKWQDTEYEEQDCSALNVRLKTMECHVSEYRDQGSRLHSSKTLNVGSKTIEWKGPKCEKYDYTEDLMQKGGMKTSKKERSK